MLFRSVPGSKGLKKLWLTKAGKKEAENIDMSGTRQIIDKLSAIDSETCEKLCEAMTFIENTLRDNDICQNFLRGNDAKGGDTE